MKDNNVFHDLKIRKNMSKGFSGIFEDDKTTKINWNTILYKTGVFQIRKII
jgi:hypothetical protein